MWTRAKALVLAAVVAVVATSHPSRAQSLQAPSDVRSVTNAGPRADAATAGVTRADTLRIPMLAGRSNVPAGPVYQRASVQHRGTTLMIVGFAALLLGAVIGDDPGTIIMVGGAGI